MPDLITIFAVRSDVVRLAIRVLQPVPEHLEVRLGPHTLGNVDLPPAVGGVIGPLDIKLTARMDQQAYRPVLGGAQYNLTSVGHHTRVGVLSEDSVALLEQITPPCDWSLEDVHRGDDDFLFFKTGGNHIFKVHQGLIRLHPDHRALWRSNLAYRAQCSRDMAIPVLTAVIPNKESVYHNLIGDGIVKSDYRPIKELQEEASDLGIPDSYLSLEDVLERAAADSRHLYRKTTAYWTPFGASLAFNKIADVLAKSAFPRIEHFYPTDFKPRKLIEITQWSVLFDPPVVEEFDQLELASLSSEIVFDNAVHNRGHLRIHRNAGRTGVVLVFGDSFTFNILYMFFAERFGTVVLAHGTAFDRSLVEEVRPDLVVCMIIERFLIYPPSDNETTSLLRVAEELGKATADDTRAAVQAVRNLKSAATA